MNSTQVHALLFSSTIASSTSSSVADIWVSGSNRLTCIWSFYMADWLWLFRMFYTHSVWCDTGGLSFPASSLPFFSVLHVFTVFPRTCHKSSGNGSNFALAPALVAVIFWLIFSIDDREEALMRSVVGGNAVRDGLAVNFLLTAFFIRGK